MSRFVVLLLGVSAVVALSGCDMRSTGFPKTDTGFDNGPGQYFEGYP